MAGLRAGHKPKAMWANAPLRLGELIALFFFGSIGLGVLTLTRFPELEWAQPAFFACVGVFLALFIHLLTGQAAASIGAHRERESRRGA